MTATAAGSGQVEPELDRLHRQRRRHRLPGRALPGRGLHQLRPGRHADRHHLQRHRPLRRRPPTATGSGPSTPPATSAPTPTIATRHHPGRADTTPPSAPTGLTATAGQHRPDQPQLDRLHRQRRRHRLPRRALPGRGLHQLRPGRHADRRPPTTTPAWRRRRTYSYHVRAVDAAGNLERLLERSRRATTPAPRRHDAAVGARRARRRPRSAPPGST